MFSFSRRTSYGRFSEQFWNFVAACKSGKKSLFLHPDFVCMDMKTYRELLAEADRKQIAEMIIFDELAEFPTDQAPPTETRS